jgi:hypothetical protein
MAAEQPTRVQPGRVGKRSKYSVEELEGENFGKYGDDLKRPKANSRFFDVDAVPRARMEAVSEVEKVREQLEARIPFTAPSFEAGVEYPTTMAFGPTNGYGAGIVDSRWLTDVHNFGPGSLFWQLSEEVGPTKPAKVRPLPAALRPASLRAATRLTPAIDGI